MYISQSKQEYEKLMNECNYKMVLRLMQLSDEELENLVIKERAEEEALIAKYSKRK